MSFIFNIAYANEGGMQFIENKGQWPSQIYYQSPLNFGEIYFEKDNFTFLLFDNPNKHQHLTSEMNNHSEDNHSSKGHHFKIQFLNSQTTEIKSINEPLLNYYNYFIGNNPQNWASYVAAYSTIQYENIYQGINMQVSGYGNDMKYEYYLSPYADFSLIKTKYLGIDNIQIKDGNLVYKTLKSDITELKPYAFQIIDNKEIEVKCNYVLNKKTNTVSFNFPNGYDTSKELVIDPQIIFTRLTESTNSNFGFTATYDDLGRAYGGGIVFNSGGIYPTTLGAYDQTFNGGHIDIGITCYHETTGAIIYSTLIGGDSTDLPNSMIINNAGELVVLGTTSSPNFPMSLNNTAFDSTYNGGDTAIFSNNGVSLETGSDIILFKLSNDGSNLNASTYLGGTGNDGLNDDNIYQNIYDSTDLNFNYGDVFRGEVIVDSSDNIYIASSTNSIDFPIVNSSTYFQGFQDAIIVKFKTNLDTILFSRFLGGSDDDAAYSMKIDNNGNLFVVGGTKSMDFPVGLNGTTPTYLGGVADGYIAKLDGDTGNIIQTIYVGTSNYDQVILIDLDLDNNVYVVGQTLGHYPIFNAIYGTPNTKHFIHKFSNDLSSTFYSTTFGSDTSFVQISPTALLVDICDRVFVSGWGGYTNFFRNSTSTTYDLMNLPLTIDAVQSTYNGFGDFYFFILDKDATSLEYATFFGGTAQEHVDGGTSRFDENGIIYQAVCAACSGGTFPSSAGYAQTTTTQCNLGVIKFDLELPSTNVDVDAFPRATGCVPLVVNFNGVYDNVTSFNWDFGDGNTSIDPNPIHTYTDTGIYYVTLIGLDSNSCNLADTATLSVLVEDDSLSANFTNNLIIDCNSLTVSAKASNYATTDYVWDMGDGNFLYTDSIYYQYASAGNYKIQLVISDSTSCELADSSSIDITLLPTLNNEIIASDTTGCIPLSVNFSSGHINYDSIYWDFGNGNYNNANHSFNQIYTTANTYNVSLVLIDSNSCNITDTAYMTVTTIDDSTHIDYQLDSIFFQCDSMQLNTTSNYNNATSYYWDFGNGQISNTPNANTIYNAGDYIGTHIITDTNNICYPSDTALFNIMLLPKLYAEIIADTLGCIPFDVNFNSFSSSNTAVYNWNFGDGNTSSIQNPVYTYTNVGLYNVNLIVEDTNTCNVTVIDQATVQTITGEVFVDITITPTYYACDSIVLSLDANYIGGLHEWNMGNGDILYGQNISYTYTQYGNYPITYTITDSSQECLSQDTAIRNINFFEVNASLSASDTSGCIPLEVDFNNLSLGNNNYLWNNGQNNNGTTEQLPTIIYNNIGNFPFTLIAIDSQSCNFSDTAIINISTRNDSVIAAYNFSILSNCDSLLSINLDNQSIDALNYYWDFGNGTSNLAEPGTYTYSNIGNHTIQLIAENQNLCHPLDTVSYNFDLLPNSTALFEATNVCETDLIRFINLSNPNAEFIWNFGNGNTSTEFNPETIYNNDGFYTIELVVIDTNSCNVYDTLTQEIEVYNYPIARFTTDTNYYLYPDEISFTNLSIGYDEFIWNFGDGNTNFIEVDPIHFYESINTFTPCLIVNNQNCADTICKDITIDFIPLIGVPNAFSPNNDGVNDIIYVEGEGIVNLNFTIYNRWGEIVFETDNQREGWDGIYKGVLQEMEVYTYVVNAILIDNSNQILKGNITLLH